MFNRVFVALWLAFFSATLGLGMVGPILPLFAQQLGARGVELGLAFSGFAILQMVSTPFTGRFSDRGGRKWLILIGLLIYAGVAFGYHSISHVSFLLGLRMLSGLGTALVFPLTVAYAGELAPAGREGTYMGVFSLADITGFGLGPLVGGGVRAIYGFEGVFLSMAVLVLLSAVAVFIFVPAQPRGLRANSGRTPVVPIRRCLQHPLLQAVFLTRLVWSIAEGASYSFLAVLIADHLRASAFFVGLALSTRDLVTGACQPLSGRLADRVDRLRMVPVGLVLLAGSQFLLPWSPHYLVLLTLLVAAGVSSSLFWAAASALQVEAGRELGMGMVMGVLEAAFGAGILTGSIIGGLVISALGIDSPFVVAGICGLCAAAAFPRLSRRVRAVRQGPVPALAGVERE